MNKMISVASGFQYSVNIGYDLNNVDKLRNFIPTKSAISLMTEILASTSPTSTDRARVLIGAYGKGKSHIVLTILSLLLKKDLDLFEKLMPKIEADPRLSQLVQNYYESENMILPVVITGSSTSLTQAFTLSLQRTLSEFGLIDAMPETNYKAAIAVIERWEKDFPETFAKFSEQIDEPVSMFTEKLASYDSSAYETFERIYPSLTAGSVFNPFLGFDVVELYESVAKSLKPKGYTGIYVIYDEFSKFLEANITTASVSDTKMLQDFAEKCTRSGKLQLHLMLISHKEISNYIDKLPQQKVDGWRGVSERFRHIHMNNNFSQTYEIISSVIQHHEPEWSKFISKKANEFGILLSRYGKHQMFADATSELNTAIYGCYPLHPVSTFILPRLSERVAQNERTLFTFLSAEGAATLPSFIEKSETAEFSLITPDLIYDYFEPLFKKEAYAGDIHSMYVLTSTILNQLEDGALPSRIVKAMVQAKIDGNEDQVEDVIAASLPALPLHQIAKEIRRSDYIYETTGEKIISIAERSLCCSDEDVIKYASATLQRERLMDLLDELPERTELILRARWGLDDGQERTLEEVGQMFNLTRERIRQIEAKALRKLQNRMKPPKKRGPKPKSEKEKQPEETAENTELMQDGHAISEATQRVLNSWKALEDYNKKRGVEINSPMQPKKRGRPPKKRTI